MIDKTGTLDFFKDRIKELEAENAALKELLSEQDYVYNRKTNDLIERHSDLLLAAQHRIKVLREALESVVVTSDLSLQEIASRMQEVGATSIPASDAMVKSFDDLKRIKELLATHDNTAELDALKKDAERYRWLLSSARITDSLWDAIDPRFTEDERHINNAIDAAMKETPK